MRTRTAVRLLAVTALLVLSFTFAPPASSLPSCDPATCNQNCIRQGFFAGGCVQGRCFCISVIP